MAEPTSPRGTPTAGVVQYRPVRISGAPLRDRATTAKIPPAIEDLWLAESMRARRERQAQRRARWVFAIGMVVVFALLLVGSTVPVTRSFAFSVGSSPASSVPANPCLGTQAFGGGAKVQFSWTSSPVEGSFGATPDFVLLGPAGAQLDNETAFLGSFTFTAQTGTYSFELANCSPFVGPLQVSGQYTAPML